MNLSKTPFYFKTWFIALLASFSIYVVPLLITIILIVLKIRYDKKRDAFIVQKTKDEYREIGDKIISNANKLVAIKEIEALKIISEANKSSRDILDATNDIIEKKNCAEEKLNELKELIVKEEKKEASLKKKITTLKIVQKSIKESAELYRQAGEYTDNIPTEFYTLYPSIELPLHSLDVKVLKSRVTSIRKEINKLLESYHKRYTTKANKAIYELMVLSLQSELQNILYNMKFGDIEGSKTAIEEITLKYLKIAGEGNQTIYNTLVRFIGEIKSFFLELVDTEYEYYVKREREKEEQRLLREQMRQEVEERKRLAEERKKIESEEQKYHNELENLTKTISESTDQSKIDELNNRILELQNMLGDLHVKKDEIINLQNGKAGNVYIISNIGSFGENIFKVGMTRRLEPMDRVNELSSASVPFPFDVHSFIFSEDAPSLESKIHEKLNDHRVNKVNLRKEFFNVTIDDIENLVNDIEPTAEFKRSIIAQEYRQSIKIAN